MKKKREREEDSDLTKNRVLFCLIGRASKLRLIVQNVLKSLFNEDIRLDFNSPPLVNVV